MVRALLDEDVRCPVLWRTLAVRHGLGCLGERPDGGRKCGFSDLGYHAGVCWEVPLCCEHPLLVGVVGVRESYCLWVYCGSVVPEGVPGGAPVCTCGASRGLHGLRRGGVFEGNIVQAVDFSSPRCLPVRQRGVVFGAVQGILDSCPLRVGVNGNVGVRCRVYPDSLCESCLGCLVVVSQGCAFNGGRALDGYEKVHGLC